MAYSIELSNGVVLNNLRMNGNNFISDSIIEKSIFDHNLSPVVISSDDPNNIDSFIEIGVHSNMDLVQITYNENTKEWWFILRDVSESELQYAKMRSDIEYLAMMTDVEL